MPFVVLNDLLRKAHAEQYAVPAVEIRDLGEALTVMGAAEQARAPVVFTMGCDTQDVRTVTAVFAGLRRAVADSELPAVLLARCGNDPRAIAQAINAGATALLIVPQTSTGEIAASVALARAAGVQVLVRAAGMHDARTLAAFRELTGADGLALTGGYERLAGITRTLQVPLAVLESANLHERPVRTLISGGVALMHVEAGLQGAMLHAMKNCGVKPYAEARGCIHEALATEFQRLARLLGADARAERALGACRRVREVEHLVAFNAPTLGGGEVEELLATGREQLGAIPGVRRVFTGRALQDDARYRHAWVVRFAGPEVVASYRDHPAHVAFADGRFRPVAGDRLSIDYEEV